MKATMKTVIAHRGVWSATRPENSYAAIMDGCRQGYAVEIDARMTRDRHLVLSHDEGLQRVYGLGKVIRNCDVASLKMLCLLEDALQAVASANTQAFIHVKELDALDPVMGKISAGQALAQCVLFADGDNTRILIEQCKKRNASARTAIHMRSAGDYQQMLNLPVECFWLDEEQGPWITAVIIREMKKQRRLVCIVSPEVWGGALPHAQVSDLWLNWTSWGADGICTDLPIYANEVLEDQIEGKTR